MQGKNDATQRRRTGSALVGTPAACRMRGCVYCIDRQGVRVRWTKAGAAVLYLLSPKTENRVVAERAQATCCCCSFHAAILRPTHSSTLWPQFIST
jgi:hypothetical protein